MSLKNLAPLTATIPFGENSLTVRGLALADLSTIIRQEGAFIGRELKSLTEMAFLDGDLSPGDAVSMAGTLLDKSPPLAAAMIAAGCDEGGEPEAINIAMRLPLGVQLAALEAIVKMTFAGSSPQRTIETVVQAIRSTSALTSAEFAAIAADRN
jgi:hypothetical protein